MIPRFQCEMQAYQNMGGGRYGKGPVAVPSMSCCEFMETDDMVMPIVRKISNLPESCPFKKVSKPKKSSRGEM